MDPFEEVLATFQQKMERLQSQGRSVTPEQMEDWLRRNTGGKYGLDAARESMGRAKMAKPGLMQGLGEQALEGASLGLASHVLGDEFKQRQNQFEKEHSVLAPVAQVAGSFALPAAGALRGGKLALKLAGSALGRAATGATAGGITAATEGDDVPMETRLKRGAVGAGIGGALAATIPPGAALGKRIYRRFRPPGVAETAAGILPKNAANLMARRESLAPGTSVAAALDPDLATSVRHLHADPKVSRAAIRGGEGRIQKISTALRKVGDRYDAALGGRKSRPALPNNGPDITALVQRNAIALDTKGELTLLTAQRLRNQLMRKIVSLKGPERHDMGVEIKQLTNWLREQSPVLKQLDKDYMNLSMNKRANEVLVKNIHQSRKSTGSSWMAGMEPGSPAGAISSARGAAATVVAPDRGKRARDTYNLLLRPGSDIHPEILKYMQRMNRGPGSKGLLGAFGAGAIPAQAFGLLDPDADPLQY
jgi:hypothetical protein